MLDVCELREKFPSPDSGQNATYETINPLASSFHWAHSILLDPVEQYRTTDHYARIAINTQ